MTQWQFLFSSSTVCGVGSIRHIGTELNKLGGKRPLIVAGSHIEKSGLLDSVRDSLGECGLRGELFVRSQINPTDDDVVAGAKLYTESKCDSILALGGGSRMDAAKAIRLIVAQGGQLEDYYFDAGGASRIRPNMPPLICVPTTAGSGSEVSRGAVITDTKKLRKRLLAGPGMVANLAILDPELSASMPSRLTAETGMDAFSHALETYVGTNFNPFAEGLSRHAVKIIHSSLPRVVENGLDLDGRMQMLIGSSMGALGFAKGLGVVHSLAHQLLDVPHGLAISILLPYGMEFNLSEAKDAYADLANAMGIVVGRDDSLAGAQAAIATVRSFAKQFNLPQNLGDAGVKAGDITQIAAGAMEDHCHRTNPRVCNESDMIDILERAL
jgi:4-hydroxybutyrate dehydrogenase